MSMGLAVMVLMLAMFVMVMIAMAVAMIMRMIVRRVIVVRVTLVIMVPVIMVPVIIVTVCAMTVFRMAMFSVAVFSMAMFGKGMLAGIGAAFGIERRLDLDDARAEALHHRLDDVIAPDPQALGHDLGRQMPVAEMPGDPNQMMRIDAADFHQRLRRGDHFDQPAVLEHQRVAAAQRYGVFKIEQEFEPARADHRHPPPVPVVEIEHDGIGGAPAVQRCCG